MILYRWSEEKVAMATARGRGRKDVRGRSRLERSEILVKILDLPDQLQGSVGTGTTPERFYLLLSFKVLQLMSSM